MKSATSREFSIVSVVGMSEQSSKSFLGLLSKSGLVPKDDLKKILGDFQKANPGKKLDAFTRHLIESGVITTWQLGKLKQGKYKGYFLGKYKLLGHLGTGGMSSVYLAEDSIMKQQRAIKVLPRTRVDDRSYLDRFYLEGRAAASLNHPNIVRVYDIDNDGSTHYLVMEYVQGQDLSVMVEENGPLAVEQAIKYVIAGAQGLAHAHERSLVHRDVKPANFLINSQGQAKLLDMGLALFREEEHSLTVEHGEKVIGTADYLAPEQAINSHNVDHRVDIYALGCTLYFCLTGHPPFPEGTLAQRIAMHQTVMPKPIERNDCPSDLLSVLNGMIQKDPDARYPTCQMVTDDLTAILENRPVSEFAKAATTSKLPGVSPRAAKVAADAVTSQPPAQQEIEEEVVASVSVVDEPTSAATAGAPVPQGSSLIQTDEIPKPVVSRKEIQTLPKSAEKKYRTKKKNPAVTLILGFVVVAMLLVLIGVMALVMWLT